MNSALSALAAALLGTSAFCLAALDAAGSVTYEYHRGWYWAVGALLATGIAIGHATRNQCWKYG